MGALALVAGRAAGLEGKRLCALGSAAVLAGVVAGVLLASVGVVPVARFFLVACGALAGLFFLVLCGLRL